MKLFRTESGSIRYGNKPADYTMIENRCSQPKSETERCTNELSSFLSVKPDTIPDTIPTRFPIPAWVDITSHYRILTTQNEGGLAPLVVRHPLGALDGGLTGGCFGNSSNLGGHSSKANSCH